MQRDRFGEIPRRRWGEDRFIGSRRDNMAHFKAPKRVVFGPLPKTSTGKIQKYVLRERAKEV